MKRIFQITLFVVLIIVLPSCDVLLKSIQNNPQILPKPARANTLQLPANKDRIPTLSYVAGNIMNFNVVPNGIKYKDYIFNDVTINTVYYKKGAPNYNSTTKDLIADIVSPKNDNTKGRPCLIFLFGGGFMGKFDDCTQEVCKGMAQKGYVVVAADYRIGYDNSLGAVHCDGDFNTGFYPAYFRAIQDTRSLVRYLKANAEQLGINPNQIFISGQSAGALTALGLVFINKDNAPADILKQIGGNLDPMNDNMQYSTTVAGVIPMAGAVIDPYIVIGKQINTPISFITGTCDELIDMNQGNPFKCQDRKTFPVIYGGAAIYEVMKEKNKVQLNLICNGGHGMTTLGYGKLLDIVSSFTYSVLQNNPLTGKQIIAADKGVCNKSELCK